MGAGDSLTAAFHAVARARGDRPALAVDGEQATFAELDGRAARVGGALRDAGVRPGDRILLCGPSSLGLAAAYLGILRAEGVMVPADAGATEAELTRQAEAARAQAGFGAVLGGVLDRVWDLAELPSGPPLPAPSPAVDDAAVLAFTSGTTGPPKGVPLTHGNLLSSVRGAMEAWRWSADDVLVHALPLSHQHGLSGVHATLLAGSRAALLSRFDPAELCGLISRERATVLFAVPAMYERLCDWDGMADADLASLRLAVSGSAPLSPALFERVAAALGQPPLERYGSTETGLSVSNPYDGPRKAGKVGLPLPGIELDVVDDEVVLRGPQVFGGYEGRPEETERAFLAGGWFKTGDLGRIDPVDGYLGITGRRKELIVSGGLNVSPGEVELALEEHPEVARAAVVGVPSERWGEEVVAAVVPADGEQPAGDALIAHVRERLSAYKCPKRVILVDELPADRMGKVRRDEIVHMIEREEGAWTSA
jgi:malonyl-CoA/methylmalonyl-CoA synthetase